MTHPPVITDSEAPPSARLSFGVEIEFQLKYMSINDPPPKKDERKVHFTPKSSHRATPDSTPSFGTEYELDPKVLTKDIAKTLASAGFPCVACDVEDPYWGSLSKWGVGFDDTIADSLN
jgi:hypothetical protein